MAAPDPADAALEGKVTALLAPYGLHENDRHETIKGAAVAAGEQIKIFASLRKEMGHKYIWSAPMVTMKLGGVMLTGVQGLLGDLQNDLRDLTDRLADMTEGETRKAARPYAVSIHVPAFVSR